MLQAAVAVTLVAVAVVGVVAGCAEIAGPLKVAYIIYLQSHAKKPKRDLVVVVVAGQAAVATDGSCRWSQGGWGIERGSEGKLRLQLELQLKLKLLLVLANSAICNWPGQLNLIRNYLSRAIVCIETLLHLPAPSPHPLATLFIFIIGRIYPHCISSAYCQTVSQALHK